MHERYEEHIQRFGAENMKLRNNLKEQGADGKNMVK
jgi:hypothetical protein